MKTIEYRFTDRIDKSVWPDGPWKSEPDKIQWPDAKTGLPCLIVRHPDLGHLCGYVGVPEGHPAFELDHDKRDAEVHGGLTFSSFCDPREDESGICHIVEPGEPDRVWWLGFDCAHSGDLSPGMPTTYSFQGDTYRDVPYVKKQCRSLARQLKKQAGAKAA